jgi:hypothetical protein
VPSTATLEPLFKTPTVAPTNDLSCPGALPSGWGTTTPGPMWSAQCGNCLLTLTPHPTGTPFPVPDWAQTATAAAYGTATPGPSPTVAVIPAATVTVTGGSCGAATQTAMPTPTAASNTVNDNNVWVSYHGSFTYVTGITGAYGSDYTRFSSGGTPCSSCYWTFEFDGSYVAQYSPTSTNQGKGDVYVDGVLVGTFDAYSSFTVQQVKIFEWAGTQGHHTLRIQGATTKNASSSGYSLTNDRISYVGAAATSTPWPAGGSITCNVSSPVPCTQLASNLLRFDGDDDGASLMFTGGVTRLYVTFDALENTIEGNGPVSIVFGSQGGAPIWTVTPIAVCNGDHRCNSTHLTSTLQTAADADGFSFKAGGYGATIHGGFTAYVSTYPCINPTAVPTATPGGGPSGYCAEVGGFTPPDLSDLPNIQIGPASCAGFGPFTIGLSGLNWLPGLSGLDNVSIPQVEICFREIYFGSVTVFGMVFSLDILSAVISGILALRWLFRS